jgi:hypothetical protein
MVDANQSSGLNILRSAGVRRRPRAGDAGGWCTARFYDRIDRRNLRTGLWRPPAQAPAGSPGNAGRSYMAVSGGRPAMGKDQPSDSTVFSATRHAFLACGLRGMPGILGRTFRGKAFPGTARGGRDARWGRMTVYPAVGSPGSRILKETLFFATRFGGRTSKKITRRVERNPV